MCVSVCAMPAGGATEVAAARWGGTEGGWREGGFAAVTGEWEVRPGEAPAGDALVFGEGAPTVSPRVREDRLGVGRPRIGKVAPKRGRGVSVEAVTALLEGLGTGESEGGVDALGERLADVEVRMRRRKNEEGGGELGVGDVGVEDVAAGASGAADDACDAGDAVHAGRVENVEDAENGGIVEKLENEESADIAGDEEEDVANELSFLVQRCEIEPDDTPAPFMPYIV